MKGQEFKAYVIEETEGVFSGEIKTKKIEELPEGDILVNVKYSSLNYKDALSASGNKGVTRNFPHTPGIDAVGVVANSTSKEFKVGDQVIVTSYDLGMNTAGGFSEYIRVPSNWVVKLPKAMSMAEAMMYGTAGLTAGMSVLRLTELVKPEDGAIAVSGATGGVGSLSVAILSKLGYKVTAITGKESETDYLKSIGASEILLRSEIDTIEKRPLLKPLFAGAIDTVGGVILENILKLTKPMGTVTCCGNVASIKLDLTIFPFILRGVTLVGIDSQNYPMEYREKVWKKLASDWKPSNLEATSDEVLLEELPEKIEMMLKGQLKRHTLVKISEND